MGSPTKLKKMTSSSLKNKSALKAERKLLSARMSEDKRIILHGDALSVLKTMPSKSVHCCVTSPPYYSLRDYGVEGQIGLEHTPEQFIKNLVKIFAEVHRVLRDDGTLWVNIGDSYATDDIVKRHKIEYGEESDLKKKDLIGVPWMFAFAMRKYGWYLRQDIIWHKTNPTPESVTDRCTRSHEYIYLFSKDSKYHFDYEAIREVGLQTAGKSLGKVGGTKHSTLEGITHDGKKSGLYSGKEIVSNGMRNKRSVWSIPVGASGSLGAGGSETHIASYPPNLIEPCILAGCPKGGTVLDPFSGTGTTGIMALRNKRKSVAIELNVDSIAIQERRCKRNNLVKLLV
jgi:site-specific DNA-methyltransferase (adenine-specific)